LIVLVAARGNSGQLLRKEKDEASPTICFRQDSLNAFIPRFAGVWRFFYFQNLPAPRWSLNPNRSVNFCSRHKIERSAK
jgi:hypothetical protein